MSTDDDDIIGMGEMPREMGFGNITNGNGARFLWAIAVVFITLLVGQAAWLGNAVISMESQMSAMSVKIDILMADRKHVP